MIGLILITAVVEPVGMAITDECKSLQAQAINDLEKLCARIDVSAEEDAVLYQSSHTNGRNIAPLIGESITKTAGKKLSCKGHEF